MNFMNARHFSIKNASFTVSVATLALLLSGETPALALGNTTGQEYGDAVYRKLSSTSWLGYNYNHAGLFAGQSGGGKRCIEADTLTGDTTKDNSFSGSFSGYGSDYYGAFQLSNRTLTFSERRSIMATAKQVADAYIYYTYFSALDPITSTRPVTIANIDNLRCDGVVEYSYEWNDFQSWWHTSYPSRWDISLYPAEHNDAPDATVNPNTEESPWSQRGAPSGSSEGPGFSGTNPNNAYLKNSAVTGNPTLQNPSYFRINNTTLDVTISATDVSGIAYIGYKLPGSSTWLYSPWQVQHPTSGTYAYVIRITSAGTLYYFAEDNGGNSPSSAPGVSFFTVSLSAGAGGTISPSGSELIPYGHADTFTASPNANYTVDKWYLDGTAVQTGGNSYTLANVQANRSLQVTFKLNAATITVVASPSNGGTVSGGGTYTVGSSRQISATANSGWTFTGWSDGGAQTHNVTVPAGGATYTANFQQQTATITVVASPSNGGTVSGGGTYTVGSPRQISATANSGWTFTGWSDGGAQTHNVTVPAGGATYTANFQQQTATIAVVASPSNGGTVSGGGTYTVGSSRQISATANSGWTFTGWSDGNTQNPRTITVPAGSATYTANFQQQTATITVVANPSNGGTVSGGGTCAVGSSQQISATANSGWTFTGWSDGGAQTHNVTVPSGGATYTANFTQAPTATIAVIASPSNGGTVGGGGTYAVGSSQQISATANSGWTFTGWSDGGAQTHNVTVPAGGATYTANFQQQTATITVVASPSNGGTMSGGGTFAVGSSQQISATANSGWTFTGWSDGGAQTHNVTVPSGGATYTANFTQGPTATIAVIASPSNGGTVGGGGTYAVGSSQQISATANSGWTFTGWSDGGAQTHNVTVPAGGATYTASFQQQTTTIPVVVNASGRSFSVDGTTYTTAQTFNWVPGSSHTIATTSPQSGGTGIQYVWSGWSDGGAMSHSVAPTSATTYTANFTTQYYLTMSTGAGGGVSPASGYYNSGATVPIGATANGGYSFSSWTGSGSGSYSGNNSSSSVTMNSPITETAGFTTTTTPVGLVAHWPLEEGTGATAADFSGGGRTGTLTGGTSWTAGQVDGDAVLFDGVSGRMTFPALPLTTTYTVSLWVYPVPSSQGYAALLTQGQQYGIWYRGGSRKLDLIWNGSTTAHLNATPLTEDQWHHIAMVNNAGSATFYVDGVADGTAAGAGGFNADSLGNDPAGEAFKGRLDEVRVYDRALSSAEVAALAAPPTPPVGLVAYWPLEEGSGSTTADASGGVRTGTLTGGTSWAAGQVGSSAGLFDGVTGRMTFSALPLTTTYTVSLWVHPVPSSQNYAALLTQGQQYGIWYHGGSRKLDLLWPGSAAAHLNQTPLTENQWHHIAVVNNGGNATFYVDGVADGTTAGAAGFIADSVGNDPAGDAFKGRLDEVRVYDLALSAAEVAALAGPPKPPVGLIAHWPLEEGSGSTTADASGGGRSGTLTGGTSRTAGQVASGALSFDGVTGRVTFSALPLTTTYTVSLWVHPVPSSQNYAALLTQGQQYGIWYRGGSRKLDLLWNGSTDHLNATPLTENQWHHVAVVNNAGSATFYVDGVADGTAAGAAGFIADSIGHDAAGDAFKGRMDEVRVYDRALSAAEVAALAGPPPGLAVLSVTPGEVVLSLRVDGSRSYAVEASTDLVIWVQLPNVLTPGTNQVTDSSGSAQRFYRLVPLP